MTATADVLVVGLGAFGSAILYQLAKRGVRAVGVDRFRPPHTMGSSHGETRITRLAVGEGEDYAPLVRRSHEIWRELEREHGSSLLLETGGLILASRDSTAQHHGRIDFVRRSIAVAERFGIPHEVLDAAEIGARFPQFLLRGDELGYFEPSAGVLAPECCVAAQLRQAQRHGATCRTDERVLEVRQHGAGVRIVTDRGTLDAGSCVITAGPWVAGLAPGGPGQLVRVHRQVLHWFEPHAPLDYAPGRFPVFIWMHGEGESDYFYGFPVVGGTTDLKAATETYDEAVDPDTVNRTVADGEAESMFRQHVAGRLRDLAGRATRSAVCLYTVTPDAGFVVDALPSQDRVLVVSACSGHGFKHSAAMGEAVAQRLLGEEGSIDLTPFALRRFATAG